MAQKEQKDRNIHGNQGEGNKEADRRYREGVERFEREGRVQPAAEEARDELENELEDELEKEDAEATLDRLR